jgi:hypothetical protein
MVNFLCEFDSFYAKKQTLTLIFVKILPKAVTLWQFSAPMRRFGRSKT